MAGSTTWFKVLAIIGNSLLTVKLSLAMLQKPEAAVVMLLLGMCLTVLLAYSL